MQSARLGIERVLFVNKRYTKGVSFLSEMVNKKGKGLEFEAEPPGIKLC